MTKKKKPDEVEVGYIVLCNGRAYGIFGEYADADHWAHCTLKDSYNVLSVCI